MEAKRLRPTRSGLFAIELMAAVGIFTLCAALCVGLFVKAEMKSRASADLTRAVNEARSISECFKAASGDLSETQALCGGALTERTLFFYYDKDWNICEAPCAGGFRIELNAEVPGSFAVSGALCAVFENTGEALLSWRLSALREAKP